MKLTNRTVEKSESDTTVLTSRKVKFKIPSDTISFNSSVASGIYFIKTKDNVTVPCVTIENKVYEVKNGNMTLKVKVDSLANIAIEATNRERELEIEVFDKTRTIIKQQKIIEQYEQRETLFNKIIKKVIHGVVGLLLLAIVVFVIYRKIRGKLFGWV